MPFISLSNKCFSVIILQREDKGCKLFNAIVYPTLRFDRINPERKCFLRKINNSNNFIQWFHPQRSPEGYVRIFDETISDTSRIRPFVCSEQ